MKMNGKKSYKEYSVADAIKAYPYIARKIPAECLLDPKYVVRVRDNKDGSTDIEVGYNHDLFEISD